MYLFQCAWLHNFAASILFQHRLKFETAVTVYMYFVPNTQYAQCTVSCYFSYELKIHSSFVKWVSFSIVSLLPFWTYTWAQLVKMADCFQTVLLGFCSSDFSGYVCMLLLFKIRCARDWQIRSLFSIAVECRFDSNNHSSSYMTVFICIRMCMFIEYHGL